ncbi:MAG TPA: hypothetical protein VLJ42_08095, partial [Solirubrobacteraceae bacterium]|nr:hypothetical protein [Solirubrobacteraceae bacterium]
SDHPDHDDPYWEDEHEPLPGRPRRRLLTPVTALLFAVLVGASCFIAGVQVEKQQLPSGGARSAGAGGGAGRLALAGASPPRGGATIGQVANVSKSNLFVTNTQGNTVKVVVVKGATVTKQISTSAKAVRPGDTVIVQGVTRADGSIHATSVRDSGAGGVGGLGGGLFGGGAGGGSARSGGSGASSSGGGAGSSGAGSAGPGPVLFGPGG